MQLINNKLIYLIFEIIIIFLLVLITIPVWNTFQISNASTIAKEYDDFNYIDLYEANSIESIIYNSKNNDNKPGTLVVKNFGSIDKNYNFVVSLKKELNYDYHNMIINLNGNENNLANYYYLEDDNNYYFLLDNQNIKAYDEIEYDLFFYTINNTINQKVAFSFLVS